MKRFATRERSRSKARWWLRAIRSILTMTLLASASARPAIAVPSPLQGEWQRWVTPDARYLHAAAHDVAGRRMFVFGGRNVGTGSLDDLWELELAAGPEWNHLEVIGPAPVARAGHSLVYDSVGNRLVLVGGFDDRGLVNREIWILPLDVRPLAWTYDFATGHAPESISQAVGAFDAPHNRIIFHGGLEGGRISRRVWALELGSPLHWSQLSTAGPSPGPRYRHCGAFDLTGDRLLVFGGNDSLGSLHSDAWALDLSGTPTWSELTTVGPGPLPRAEASAVYNPDEQQLTIFGGGTDNGNYFSDVWTLSLNGAPSWTEVARTPLWPEPLRMHTATFDPPSRAMLVFGGFTPPIGPTSDQLWSFSTDSLIWRRPAMPAAGPVSRRHACFVVDPQAGEALMFGGQSPSASLGDLWRMSLASPHAWVPVQPVGLSPSARAQAAASIDAARHRLLVHGGYTNSFPYSRELWALDLEPGGTWTSSLPADGPPGVFGHSLVYDSVRDRLLMFGGLDGSSPSALNTLWQLDLSNPTAWDSIAVAGPRPTGRLAHSAVFDPARDQMIIHGGDGPDPISGETWAFNCGANTWTELGTTGPSMLGRSGRAIALDGARQRLCLLGWQDAGHFFPGVWTLDLTNPTAWALLEPAGVAPLWNVFGSAAFDSIGDRLIALNGPLNRDREEIYELRFQTHLLPVEPDAGRAVGIRLSVRPSHVSGDTRVVFSTKGLQRVEIFDLSGRRVAVVIPKIEGSSSADWDLRSTLGERVSPGLYFAVGRGSSSVARGKVVVLD